MNFLYITIPILVTCAIFYFWDRTDTNHQDRYVENDYYPEEES